MYALSKSTKAAPDEGIVEQMSPPVLHSSDDDYYQSQSPRIATSDIENLPEEIDYVPSIASDRTRDAAMKAKLAALNDDMPPKKAHGRFIDKSAELPDPEEDIVLEQGFVRNGTRATAQGRSNEQVPEEPFSAAHHEELKQNRRWGRRPIIFIAVLVTIVAAGLALGVVFGTRSTNDDVENNTLECSRQLLDSGYACGVNDWPREGFVAVLTDCPDGEDGSVLDCASCTIYQAESRETLDPENDPTCNSCSVCDMTLAIDCSNLMEGSCAVSNCEGECTGWQ